jgi:hypothetical protein
MLATALALLTPVPPVHRVVLLAVQLRGLLLLRAHRHDLQSHTLGQVHPVRAIQAVAQELLLAALEHLAQAQDVAADCLIIQISQPV